jgi:hypothetical protein
LKILGFDNVAKLLKTLIDDILQKGEISWNEIVSVVSEVIECHEWKTLPFFLSGYGVKWRWTT